MLRRQQLPVESKLLTTRERMIRKIVREKRVKRQAAQTLHSPQRSVSSKLPRKQLSLRLSVRRERLKKNGNEKKKPVLMPSKPRRKPEKTLSKRRKTELKSSRSKGSI